MRTRRKRDGKNTREAILSAAVKVFAERGYAGSPLAAISKESGISVGLVLHHFKCKENLYRAVLEKLSADYSEKLFKAGKIEENPYESGREILAAAFRYWNENKAYTKISLWAYLENREELVPEEAKLTARLAKGLSSAQKAGKIDGGIEPFVFLTMTLGPIHFWIRYRKMFNLALGLKKTDLELDEVFLKQYSALVEKIYRPDERRPRTKETDK